MKRVDPSTYNKDYYQSAYGIPRYLPDKSYFMSRVDKKYEEMASLIKIYSRDRVVDYGCGNGNFAFYIASKYGCEVIAFDYSKAAIQICKEKQKQCQNKANKIKFINSDSEHLPDLTNVKAVFFCDVLEHVYDEEIGFILNKIKAWSGGEIKVIVQTDNNIYLKFITPIFNVLNILLGNKSIKQIIVENKIDKGLHINLTTPVFLKNKMEKWGYQQVILKYPSPIGSRIKNQLGKLTSIPYLYEIGEYILKKFPFFSPSFHAVFTNKQ